MIELKVGKKYENLAGEEITILRSTIDGKTFYDQYGCHYKDNGWWLSARHEKSDIVKELN